ncbi:hypothetical protein [Lentilactobacillus sunkii]|uniref:Uncharacterized protein n=1 Tax=Lentilactobacillus sunkii DSM 19904 TaxID=1423808 RepID=A0A0R1L202_9LACO|nr:hypothetical protein [Lentilactobacillus sunkii]KRK89846.1 hypothetical protein FD17_GL000082 [Lentilactobacillus sunkii DSM 19904]
MQNKQSYLSEITRTFKDNYDRFFEIVRNTRQIKQMPTFQINYFIKQTLENNFPITIEFIDQDEEQSGYLSKISADRYLLTSDDNRFSRIINLPEIKAIKKY